MQRVLVTGASGLLGSNIVLTLGKRFEIIAAYLKHPVHLEGVESISIDITREEECRIVLNRLKPHIVIHCAAETRVDYCEEYPEEAVRINTEGTSNVAKAAQQLGSKVIYISTDSVFDGEDGMYKEEATPHPVNVYARTKLLGEEAVRKLVSDHAVVRTTLYGWNGRPKSSLAEWVLERVERGQPVPGFQDIYFSPILVNDLAEILSDIILADLKGTYHVGGSERCSKFFFARLLCEVFNKDVTLVQPAFLEGAGLKARRPKDTSLDVGKISDILTRPMPKVVDGLQHFRQLLKESYVSKLRSGFA